MQLYVNALFIKTPPVTLYEGKLTSSDCNGKDTFTFGFKTQLTIEIILTLYIVATCIYVPILIFSQLLIALTFSGLLAFNG